MPGRSGLHRHAALDRSPLNVSWCDPRGHARHSPTKECALMCLAIPGQVVELVDVENRLARVEVGGVRRNVNVGLLDEVAPGDWVLIHVGFTLSRVDADEAQATLALLQEMGEAASP